MSSHGQIVTVRCFFSTITLEKSYVLYSELWYSMPKVMPAYSSLDQKMQSMEIQRVNLNVYVTVEITLW